MENQTSLIGQDSLSLAILETQEEKRLAQEKEQQEQQILMHHDAELAVINFLMAKTGIKSGDKAKAVLSSLNKNNRLTIYKKCLRSLILKKVNWYSFWEIMISPIPLIIYGGSYENGPMLGIGIIMAFVNMALFFYLLLQPHLLEKLFGPDEILPFRHFLGIIKILRQNITDLETNPKRIEQG